MGTRGAVGFVIDGQEKITYNHFDSYPDGLGADVLKWLDSTLHVPADPALVDPAEEMNGIDTVAVVRDAFLANLKEQVRALRLVTEAEPPTDEDIERLSKYHDGGVSTGSPTEWYSLLRDTQGDLAATLAAGVMIDNHRFPLDSLFCEWAYVIDLDSNVFEVYEGFQHSPPTEGRWVGVEPSPEDRDNGYHPVQRIASWPLNALPSTDEFYNATCRKDEDESDE